MTLAGERRFRIGERLEQREIGMGKEAGTLLMYSGGRRSGNGSLDAINADADGHATMHNETHPCASWEIRDAVNVA
jgi:hypothetical protein